ncbi:hypothetical protein D3C78_1035040 [compost metagenome]
MVPLTIHYLNKDQYGIWLTLSAIIGWFSFFDIGLGNGLRNKLVEAIANKDFNLARSYISTAYQILAITFGTIIVLFFGINYFLNWSAILNAPIALKDELSQLALITFSFFCLRFIFNLISSILFAVQYAAMNNLVTTLGNVLSFTLIYCLQFLINGSLFWVGTIFSSVPVIILFILSIILFSSRLKYLRPSFRHVNFKLISGMMGLGYKFFIIQIAGVVLFSCTEIMITQLFGPGEVTAYNIAFRYFSVLTMINGIILTPLWSAFTDAYAKNDREWIWKMVKKLNLISLIFAGLGAIMILVSDDIYKLWVGESVKIDKSISIAMGLFVIASILAAPYNTFINGVGKIRLQYYAAIFSIIGTIPLAFFFTKSLSMGTAGIIAATLSTTIPCTILYKIQFNKIMKSQATGIWNK